MATNLNPDTGLAIVPPTPTVVTTVPAPTAATVYSAPNITQAVTAPAPAPNLSDPYGLYNQFMSTPEILAAQQQVAQGQQAINASQGALRTTTRALEGQNVNALGGTGASVNLIGRQVGRARELTADELAGLGEAQNAAIANLSTLKESGAQKYQIAQQERAQLQDLIRATGGKAGISYTDSYESALQKSSNYEDKLRKEEEKKAEEAAKDAYKKELKSIAMQMGKKNLKVSTKELEKYISKTNREALAEAKAAKSAAAKGLGGSGGSLSGGYTAQELRKLREAGISASDLASADDYLYGSKLRPEEKKQLKIEDTLAKSVASMVKQGIAPSLIQQNTLDPYGYNLEELSKAYNIDLSQTEEGMFQSGQGFWGNFWSGLTGK